MLRRGPLATRRVEEVFPLLLDLAKRQPLAGVINALGSFRRPESIPCLISALSEDYSRRAAEAALLQLGSKARRALLARQSGPCRQPSGRARRAAGHGAVLFSYWRGSASRPASGREFAI